MIISLDYESTDQSSIYQFAYTNSEQELVKLFSWPDELVNLFVKSTKLPQIKHSVF